MTLVFHSNSPARQRMEAAGKAFGANGILAKRWRIAPAKQRRYARRLRMAADTARRTREELMARAAFEAERAYRAAQIRPTMRSILEAVSQRTGVSREDMMSDRRHVNIVAARHECFWLAREKTTLSYPQIGRFFDKDHTTVIHGARKHAKLVVGAGRG